MKSNKPYRRYKVTRWRQRKFEKLPCIYGVVKYKDCLVVKVRWTGNVDKNGIPEVCQLTDADGGGWYYETLPLTSLRSRTYVYWSTSYNAIYSLVHALEAENVPPEIEDWNTTQYMDLSSMKIPTTCAGRMSYYNTKLVV